VGIPTRRHEGDEGQEEGRTKFPNFPNYQIRRGRLDGINRIYGIGSEGEEK
jgi:hypothetical protein